jgi:hypothetical protein
VPVSFILRAVFLISLVVAATTIFSLKPARKTLDPFSHRENGCAKNGLSV